MNEFSQRIQDHLDEAEALDTVLSSIFDIMIEHNPPRGIGIAPRMVWVLEKFSVKDGDIRLTGRQDQYHGDYATCYYAIPEDVVADGDIEAYAKQLQAQVEEEEREAERAAKQKELDRLEARTRILRGELSGDE